MDGASAVNRWLWIQQWHADNSLCNKHGPRGRVKQDPKSDIIGDALFVPNGLGATIGLDPEQHINWALEVEHPVKYELDIHLDADMKAALEYECSQDPADIDSFISAIMENLEKDGQLLDELRGEWMETNGLVGHRLAEKIHGPLCQELIAATGYDKFDEELAEDIAGFPLLGELPPSGPDVREISRSKKP